MTGSHWFEPVADHLGAAYLRYSFTKGTVQEVDFLMEALQLQPGQRVLDVGCGGGILAESMARRGANVLGVDLADKPLKVAMLHAMEAGLGNIDYRSVAAEADREGLGFEHYLQCVAPSPSLSPNRGRGSMSARASDGPSVPVEERRRRAAARGRSMEF